MFGDAIRFFAPNLENPKDGPDIKLLHAGGGANDWHYEFTITATVFQKCFHSLIVRIEIIVRFRIKKKIIRLY